MTDKSALAAQWRALEIRACEIAQAWADARPSERPGIEREALNNQRALAKLASRLGRSGARMRTLDERIASHPERYGKQQRCSRCECIFFLRSTRKCAGCSERYRQSMRARRA